MFCCTLELVSSPCPMSVPAFLGASIKGFSRFCLDLVLAIPSSHGKLTAVDFFPFMHVFSCGKKADWRREAGRRSMVDHRFYMCLCLI